MMITGLMFTLCKAQAGVEFNYTGNYAIEEDLGLSSGPFTPSKGPIALGGPSGENTCGYASQFTMNELTHISALDVNTTALTWGGGNDSFRYNLYTGTTNHYWGEDHFDNGHPYLIPETLAYQSDVLNLTVDPSIDYTYNHFSLPFDYTFEPGTYWLEAKEVSGSDFIIPIQTYIDPPIAANVHTPEPATWLLFGIGGLLLGRRKVMGSHL